MAESDEEDVEKKGGFGAKGWAVAAILALALGGGGFYATYAGLVPGLGPSPPEEPHVAATQGPHFLELEPMLVTVGGEGSIRQLRFRAFLQLPEDGAGHVAALQPRILDICATYLRALGLDTLEDPAALLRIRAQLLRRLRLLAGPEAVDDLLIIDFVIT